MQNSTFFCLQCGYDYPRNKESDYEPNVCIYCAREQEYEHE